MTRSTSAPTLRAGPRDWRYDWELAIFGTRHAAHDGVDVGALALDLVDVQPPPRDPVVADTHDDDPALVKRRAVRLGPRPVDLDEDGVALNRGPQNLGVEVGD